MENYKEVANQWTWHSLYPQYKEFEVLFDQIIADDESTGTTTVDGEQIYIPKDNQDYQRIRDRFFLWLEQQPAFKDMTEFKCIESWIIYYQKGGYQGLHVHQGDMDKNTFSAVIHLDDVPVYHNTKNKFNGMLFSIMPEPNGYQHPQHFPSVQGGIVCLEGKVWHGVYPTDSIRRTVVYDIEYKRK
tara:strand:+ start:6912 stop:7469 length:558 start_codon:yes stop_codon:yes gene_type:complete